MGKTTIIFYMYILGISCYYHDSAAVILQDNVLIAAAEEERFSRKKHDFSFPKLAIQFCLEKAGMNAQELTYVVFYEKPLLKFERLFLTNLKNVPNGMTFFHQSMQEWFFDKLWIKSHIISELGIPADRLLFCEHHLSHMASSFLSSPFAKAALISIDAVGEWATTSWGIGTGNTIDIKEEIRFPNSIGLLYSAFTVFAGFQANEGEYKLMGLAPYGKPKYVDKIYKLLKWNRQDGSYLLKQDYFSYQYSSKGTYTRKFEDLFGTRNAHADTVIPYYADIAASIQLVLENMVLAIANYVQKKTNLNYLCYAGGVALNSKANWKILNESKYDEIYIQPAAGDSGGALGAALWVYNCVLQNKKRFLMNHAYYGASETREEIESYLKSEKIRYKKVKNENNLIEEITEKIATGKVIGWVQNEFEWGPRALGHRSILADPRSSKMKDFVNGKIKFREAFRPFAPSTILETADDFFEIGSKKNHYPFKFMLYVVPVKENKKGSLGAITHADGTARPQVVDKDTNPLYHKLIKNFGRKTGVPVILNTSLNLKGEPIVNSAKEAMSIFERSGLDSLVVHNFIIEKR